jgi:hypothetical protein
MSAEKVPEQQLQTPESKAEQGGLDMGLSKEQSKALESKYSNVHKAEKFALNTSLNTIANPRSFGGLGREFINDTILQPNARVPEQAIIALAKELKDLQQWENQEKQAVLSTDELDQLKTLLTDTTTPQTVTDFFSQQKTEFTTVSEVMNKAPEQEKLLEWFRAKVANELVVKYPNFKNDPDFLQNLSVSTLNRYVWRINQRITDSKDTETQIQQNKLLNVPLFAPRDAVLTSAEQQRLQAVLENINDTLVSVKAWEVAQNKIQFATFSAQDFHNMLDACVTGAWDIQTFNKELTPEQKNKQTTLGKELDSFIDGFAKSPKWNQTMETLTTVSKQVFDNLSKVGSWMKDYIENNFGTFETIFAIPLIWPFLKELFVGKPGEEADRYKNAKAVYEKKLATLSPGEQAVANAITEKYKALDTDLHNTNDGILQKKLAGQAWFNALFIGPAEGSKTPLTPEQTKGKGTQEALKKFDENTYVKTLFDTETISKLTADKKIINEKDPLYGKDIKAYLLTTMYMRLGNTEDVASKFAQDRIKEFTQDTPSDQLKADFATYAEGRLTKMCGEEKIAFAWPMDVVNALTFDLLKTSDQAVIAKLKPTVVTAPATTPAVPANAPAVAPQTAPQAPTTTPAATPPTK